MRRADLHVLPARWRKAARAQRKAARAVRAVPEQAELAGVLRHAQSWAQWLLAGIVIAATIAAFSESYRALILWALHHKLAGAWGVIFPAQVDTFILAGELAVFLAICRRWSYRSRVAAWLVTAGGLAASVAWNVGHVSGGDWQSRVTAAVPPLAASVALGVGLGVLKRVIQGDGTAAAGAQPEPEATRPAATALALPDEWLALVAGTVSGVVAEHLDRVLAEVGRQLAETVAALAPRPASPPPPPKSPRSRKTSATPAIRPAAEPMPGDPPVDVILAAASARALALAHPGLGRQRAGRLVAPGSYAYLTNGHSERNN